MSRRVYLLGEGIALVALALAFTDWALSLQPGVTEANVNRIRPGMTVQEVETMFGAPGVPSMWKPSPFAPYELFWAGECGVVYVEFDLATRRASSAGILRGDALNYSGCNLRPSPKTPLLDRLRAWLGW
jgi:hypothetical protein